MTHLLLRVDPTYIRRDPYVPAATAPPVIRAAEAGIRISPRGLLACLPGVSSFVGGDITAGVLASGLDRAEEPCLLLDLGTNGEVVLGNREWMMCCSASAGPAFEGSGARCGVMAVQGALQRVRIDPESLEVSWTAIGDQPPVGICGSGYVDALAEMFAAGVVDRQGTLRPDLGSPRLRRGEDGAEFVLVWAADSGTGRDVVLTQTDVENLIRAKGALFAAARVLTRAVGLTFEDVSRFYISGGFGSYLDMTRAIAIGLLPDLPPERFQFLGNSSLAGAHLALQSGEAMAAARRIAARMTSLELCDEPSYMDEYVGALFLPHTDADLFPSVKPRLQGAAP